MTPRKSNNPQITIHSWLRSRDIVEFLGLRESLHNPDFKRSKFDTFKKDAGSFIKQGLPQSDRLEKLRETAESQLRTLLTLNLQNPILANGGENGK
ncbi:MULTISPECIES: hypothetical protein [unclassified Fibrobacter]|uniref:hypothetical protein n=1 Tax=unclassified Fibrobacter TaxID=2634177 RepID=UPI000D79FD6C|nr:MULTISPECIES: hypothetical protein [unclassified Fibrobacter]PWJ60709.1 hypothetical protein BGX12_13721 [Fibrobacter sp. UWR4]PZW63913.1 hypothetical protein C8E88_103922 [Fibrobacter sp. UWR1]